MTWAGAWEGVEGFFYFLLTFLIGFIVGYFWGWSENPFRTKMPEDDDEIIKTRHDTKSTMAKLWTGVWKGAFAAAFAGGAAAAGSSISDPAHVELNKMLSTFLVGAVAGLLLYFKSPPNAPPK